MTDSWQLKLRRAKEHLENICARLAVIAPEPRDRTFRIEKERRADGNWYYSVHLDLVTDEMLPVVIGEFLFNVRSALDHIACATAHPKAQFPIFTDNIWNANAQGEEAQRLKRLRAKFDRWTKGMEPEVLAIVKWAQPCNALNPPTAPENAALSVLNLFQNADKHSELSVIVGGAGKATSRIDGFDDYDLSAAAEAKFGTSGLLPDGGVFLAFGKEVDVKFEGRVEIALRCGNEPIHRPLPETLVDIFAEASAVIDEIERVM